MKMYSSKVIFDSVDTRKVLTISAEEHTTISVKVLLKLLSSFLC